MDTQPKPTITNNTTIPNTTCLANSITCFGHLIAMAITKNHQLLAAGKEKVQFWRLNTVQEATPNMGIPRAAGLKEYTVADLKIATNNFGTFLDKGSFGNVYKGWVNEKTLAPSESEIGMAVAIKISTYSNTDSKDFEQWQRLINCLARHYHPNLIGLMGYCWEENTIAVVSEFMQKGNLWRQLFQSCVMKPLPWDIRIKIAIEAAQGLAFLHNLEKKVIHTDFKTSNILLDENYNVKLSNFGLATRGPHDEDLPVTSSMLTSTNNTQIIGTSGYCAPEYLLTGKVYIKSDVYSFGVVLLESLTGLKSIDHNRPDGEQSLVYWLEPKLSNKINLKSIMDVHMEGQYSITAAYQAAELTKKCLDSNPENRPNMRQVVEALKQIKAMEEETKNSKN